MSKQPQASSGDSRSQAPVPNPQAALVQTQHADSSKPVAVLSGAQSGKGSVVSKPRTQSPPKKATGFMCAGCGENKYLDSEMEVRKCDNSESSPFNLLCLPVLQLLSI
ncbi:hypothetical protein AKJ16_DCAP26980 [Drosera capensis]